MMNYAILGGGRLARHISHYFYLLGIPHARWVRDCGSPFNTFEFTDTEQGLRKTIGQADRVLLLVSDQAIAGLLKQYPFLHDKQLIQCSGSMSIPGVAGVHPLMTFADHLYDLDVYQSIPFVVEKGSCFTDLFPALPNPHYSISVEDKARYHAMCVMAGNFTQLMWKGIADRFEQQFDWSVDIMRPYLERVTANFIQAPDSALTGPLVRKDLATIERNTSSLEGDPLRDLYMAFIQFHQNDNSVTSGLQHQQLEQAS